MSQHDTHHVTGVLSAFMSDTAQICVYGTATALTLRKQSHLKWESVEKCSECVSLVVMYTFYGCLFINAADNSAEDTRIWGAADQHAESHYLFRTRRLLGLNKSHRRRVGVVQLCNQHQAVL